MNYFMLSTEKSFPSSLFACPKSSSTFFELGGTYLLLVSFGYSCELLHLQGVLSFFLHSVLV